MNLQQLFQVSSILPLMRLLLNMESLTIFKEQPIHSLVLLRTIRLIPHQQTVILLNLIAPLSRNSPQLFLIIYIKSTMLRCTFLSAKVFFIRW